MVSEKETAHEWYVEGYLSGYLDGWNMEIIADIQKLHAMASEDFEKMWGNEFN